MTTTSNDTTQQTATVADETVAEAPAPAPVPAPNEAAETIAEPSAAPAAPDTSDEPEASFDTKPEDVSEESPADISNPVSVTGVDAAALQQKINDLQLRHDSLLQAKADAEHALAAIQGELEDACTELENFGKRYGDHLKEVTQDIKNRFSAGRSWLARHL